MTEIKTEDERVERDIRIAIYNAGRRRGMGQDPLFSLIQSAMDEPTMKRALSAISLQDELVKALTQIVQCDDDAETKHLVLADCTDNDGEAYQSQALSNHLCRARTLLTRIKSESGGSHDKQ